ncbi:RNA-directed DNA polymerase [Aureimonas flava]|uniref:RNA-directed DNA polymerase n=1 Tax=Aureimonas flava TaxID=2320271 RepID=A0A3A1WUT3_9HYPH|nr:RNA-directed DNA polymerase [Aureimonas flava]RIY02203.1 RNA-directed DNA polymerase [Aureimonas flava]
MMKSRFHLINLGLYPETLPPCFVSKDAKRAFTGLVSHLDSQKFFERKSDFSRYNGTKHDGSRRYFGTPNIVSYFHTSSFIWKNWKLFDRKYKKSSYSISTPSLMEEFEDRAVRVPSLSELSKKTSENIRYAPFILKADIAQCFHSIYTHSISWAAHGVDASKDDTNANSAKNLFNALDFHVRNGQRGNTRGVLVGPDAFRLIAEFVLANLDQEIERRVGDKIVGAVRHVDDYYIGLQTEHDAQSVLSTLREILSSYELNVNDSKTRIISSLDPINDLWAQRVRDHTSLLYGYSSHEKIERSISEVISTARETKSDSAIKMLFRAFDEKKLYATEHWGYIEKNIQRIIQKHPHSVDYACLLVAKRFARGGYVDKEGWLAVASIIIRQGLAFDHHHEVLWMLWLMMVCKIEVPGEMIEEVAKSKNAHVRSFLIKANSDGRLRRKPKLSLGSGLSSVDSNWLTNLVARSEGYSKASFSGMYSEHFTHLAEKNIRLIDFEPHMQKIAERKSRAISRTRYGYDDDRTNDFDFGEDFDHDGE